jgi:glucan-binding YG repeat protein
MSLYPEGWSQANTNRAHSTEHSHKIKNKQMDVSCPKKKKNSPNSEANNPNSTKKQEPNYYYLEIFLSHIFQTAN